MDDEKFNYEVEETVNRLLHIIPQHGNFIFCSFPYNFPGELERKFMNEVLNIINQHYQGKYKIYYKDSANGFYLMDKQYEKTKMKEKELKESLYIASGFKDIDNTMRNDREDDDAR